MRRPQQPMLLLLATTWLVIIIFSLRASKADRIVEIKPSDGDIASTFQAVEQEGDEQITIKRTNRAYHQDEENFFEKSTKIYAGPSVAADNIKNIKTINIGLLLNPKNENKEIAFRLEQIIRRRLNEINSELRLSSIANGESSNVQTSTTKANVAGSPTNASSEIHQLIQFQLLTATIVANPIEMSKIVCQQLIGNELGGISALVVDTDDEYLSSIASVSFTLGLYSIPIIGTTSRDSSLFNKNLHSSYVSLIPPQSHQADVWYNLMVELQFKQAFVLTGANNRDLLTRLGDLIDLQQQQQQQDEKKFKIESIIEFDVSAFASEDLAWSYLVKRVSNLLENSICRVFLVHAQSKQNVQVFVDLIKQLKMNSKGFALILSEETIRVAKENNISLPSGIISSRLSLFSENLPTSVAYALDALDIVVRSISEISYQETAFRDVPNSCQLRSSNDWLTGIELYLAILRQTFSGHTGYISFNENGDRLTAIYNLLNLVEASQEEDSDISKSDEVLYGSEERRKMIMKTVGTFKNGFKASNLEGSETGTSTSESSISFTGSSDFGKQRYESVEGGQTVIDISSIEWPGAIKGQIISGIFVNKHMRIITLQEKPFVWALEDTSCWREQNNSLKNGPAQSVMRVVRDFIPCRRFNSITQSYDKFCCRGYCMDLLEEISRQLEFTFDLYLEPSNQYGNLQIENDENHPSGQVAVGSTHPKASHSRLQTGGEHGRNYEALAGSLGARTATREDLQAQAGSADVAGHDELDPDEDPDQVTAEARGTLEESSQTRFEQVDGLDGGYTAASAAAHAANEQTSGLPGASGGPGGGLRPTLEWSGVMGELVLRRADMAFAPLTITPQRAQAIDFSKPFKFHGFSILLRRASKHTTLASFLQPFHNQLWLLVIGVATHVVALTLYLLDRYSTFGRLGMKRQFIAKRARCSHDDHPLHLSSSLWFSWSILLNSGVGEHTPKSLSGRVLGIFWSSFAMIVVASYTANLAAFLVLDSREETPTLSGIDDPRLRSGDLAFNFATVRSSAVDAYLQSQVEYINLYRKMEEFNFDKVDDAILALRSGQIDALIWDSTRLEWEVASDEHCALGIAGELFGSSGYGIGLPRGSYWTKNITTKLLELHESGFMIELDRKWIGPRGGLVPRAGGDQQERRQERENEQLEHGSDLAATCERRNEDHPETLGIFNIAGIFILFACGLATSFGLILLERLCYRRRGSFRSMASQPLAFWRRLLA